MATRKTAFAVGEYYHIYNRGTECRDIFNTENDRDRFLKLLFIANNTQPISFRSLPSGSPYQRFVREELLVSIGAYCLMPNHFHLLLKEIKEGGISLFMSKLLTSYSSYFNKVNSRSGRLFEGTFKSSHADSDEYLKYLFSYIHLNPVKMIDPGWKKEGIKDLDNAKEYLSKYKYSSYLDYSSPQERPETKIINKSDFPEYFSDYTEFDDFITDWLAYKDDYPSFNENMPQIPRVTLGT